ncbi:nicotinate phosphoribosyltransferase [Parasutterella secunda]|uniref:nicotinate phosphoribosyltransferase n=1 Tax=Parasutterella secunda TaxID=626947 RepID=UPI0025A4A80B|nr:nicotinate phosphoribosyltransferase [Parasutterella secunda]MDM8113107.1 nicotinate phosphoribosyltransferase [Parasutterella secunda]
MIIESLLDTDLYKFTMMQCVLHQFPGASVEYRFRCRNEGVDLRPYIDEIKAEVDHLCTLRFKDDELEYLRSLRFIKDDFVEFLSLFQLKRKYIDISEKDGQLAITIKGPWLHTILFEIPVLAIVNETYFNHIAPNLDKTEGRKRLDAKIQMIENEPDRSLISISDFGTRRRFSRQWQKEVLEILKARLPHEFAGTSNVFYAKELNLIPMGTMAHEYLQACQALGPRLRDSQTYAFEMWAKEYRGDLGIALTDVYGIEPFLKDFDMYFCKLFDGVRQDSGDPESWGERMIEHYKANRCDPRTKTFIFSDSLTFERLIKLFRRFKGRVKLGFGVGTNLTNDLGPEPLNIVIKMVRANGQPVAKISDTPGKSLCDDPSYLAYLKQVFGMKP